MCSKRICKKQVLIFLLDMLSDAALRKVGMCQLRLKNPFDPNCRSFFHQSMGLSQFAGFSMEEELTIQFMRVEDHLGHKCHSYWKAWYRYRSAAITIVQESTAADASFKHWLQQLHDKLNHFAIDLREGGNWYFRQGKKQDKLFEHIGARRCLLRKLRKSEAQRSLLPDLLIKDVFHVFEAYL